MKIKIKKILIYSLIAIVLIYLSFWALINFYIIPKIVIPEIKKFITEEFSKDVKLSIGSISFNAFKGFQLKNVELSGPVVLADNNSILKAKKININIALPPLLKKKVEVLKMDFTDAYLRIGRWGEGVWNYQSLLEVIDKMMMEDPDDSFDFIVDEFNLKNSTLEYIDYYSENNRLYKKFVNVDMVFKSVGLSEYNLSVEACNEDKAGESLKLSLNYDESAQKTKGLCAFNSNFLGQYWDYYLDDIFTPWILNAADISADFNFTYEKDIFSLDGKYKVNTGNIKFGEICIGGNAEIKNIFNIKDQKLEKDKMLIDVLLKNLSVFAGECEILNNGVLNAKIGGNIIEFNEVSGGFYGIPVSLNGRFLFKDMDELYLTGKIGRFENIFELKLLTENTVAGSWQTRLGNTAVSIFFTSDDLDSLLFESKISGQVYLNDLFPADVSEKNKIIGQVDISGELKGKADEIPALNGEVNLNGNGITAFGLDPVNIKVESLIKNGVLNGKMDKTGFYSGGLYGRLYAEKDLWMMEINIDKMNLQKFSKFRPELEGLKGVFTGSVLSGADWKDIDTMEGGGYFRFKDCYLWSAPIFAETEKAIEETSHAEVEPNFNILEGNFVINKDNFSVENVFCDIKGMNLNAKGNIKCDGEMNFTVGVTLSGGSVLRTIRQILIPTTILFDIVANCIEIHIYGKWPDLDYSVGLQPSAFFSAVFPMTGNRADAEKYTLSKYLDKKNFPEKTKKFQSSGISVRKSNISTRHH